MEDIEQNHVKLVHKDMGSTGVEGSVNGTIHCMKLRVLLLVIVLSYQILYLHCCSGWGGGSNF